MFTAIKPLEPEHRYGNGKCHLVSESAAFQRYEYDQSGFEYPLADFSILPWSPHPSPKPDSPQSDEIQT